jgi:hypothetical protein
MKRRSPSEWSGSGYALESGSSSAVTASRKSTPCFRLLLAAFPGAHSTITRRVSPKPLHFPRLAQHRAKLQARVHSSAPGFVSFSPLLARSLWIYESKNTRKGLVQNLPGHSAEELGFPYPPVEALDLVRQNRALGFQAGR